MYAVFSIIPPIKQKSSLIVKEIVTVSLFGASVSGNIVAVIERVENKSQEHGFSALGT